MLISSDGKEEPNPQYAIWKKDDQLIKSLITATLTSEVRSLTVGLTTAQEVWKCLEDWFANSSKERSRDLTRRLKEIHRENHRSLDEYLLELKVICDELAAIHNSVDDKVYWALNGLSYKYDNFVTAMQVRSPLPSFEKFVTLSIYERRHQDSSLNENQAFFSQRQNRGRGNSHNCNQGHHGGNHFSSRGRGFTPSQHSRGSHSGSTPSRSSSQSQRPSQSMNQHSQHQRPSIICQI